MIYVTKISKITMYFRINVYYITFQNSNIDYSNNMKFYPYNI